MKPLPFLDAVKSTNHRTLLVSSQLRGLAEALHLTGNEMLAETLLQLAIELTECADEVAKAMAARAIDDFRQSQQASATVLHTVLAGAKMGRRDNVPGETEGESPS